MYSQVKLSITAADGRREDLSYEYVYRSSDNPVKLPADLPLTR